MDKVSKSRKIGMIALMACASGASAGAVAGTVLAQPEPVIQLEPGESYPESRFGHPPVRVDTGVSRGYASRAVDEMETSDEADVGATGPTARGGSRSPAGLVFATGPNRQSDGCGRAPLSPSTAPRLSEPVATLTTSQAVARLGVQEVALIASDLGYFPRTVFVSRDVPVRMFVTGSSKNTLCIMMDSFSIRKQVRSQKIEEITFTPNVPGKYRFYCPVNGMEGTMVVKDLASSQPSDAVASHASAPARREPASEAPAPVVERVSVASEAPAAAPVSAPERARPSAKASLGHGHSVGSEE